MIKGTLFLLLFIFFFFFLFFVILIFLTHKGFHFCFFLQKIEICFWLNLNQEKINWRHMETYERADVINGELMVKPVKSRVFQVFRQCLRLRGKQLLPQAILLNYYRSILSTVFVSCFDRGNSWANRAVFRDFTLIITELEDWRAVINILQYDCNLK